MRVQLIVIDPQNDFCNPHGYLYVPGAESDMARMAAFIIENKNRIDKILISKDTHDHDHIGHPCFFTNRDSKHPKPFTQITYEDLRTHKWVTTNPENNGTATEYLKLLGERDRYPHTIWPYHCLRGTFGVEIVPEIEKAISIFDPDPNGPRKVSILTKGENKLAEEYSIMGPEVRRSARGSAPFAAHAFDVGSGINGERVISSIYNADLILVGGEAGSHCVANSLIDIYDRLVADSATHLMENIVLLEDTTSPVPGFEHLQKKAFRKLAEAGMRISNTKEMTKELS